MSWHAADAAELKRLWPAARSSQVAASRSEFVALASTAPWRVRINDAGDGMVLQPWRAHLEHLSLRAAWAPEQRVGELVTEASAVGRMHGYTDLLSPLVTERAFRPYAEAGMELAERIVAYQGTLTRLARATRSLEPAASFRPATVRDVDALVALDRSCFDDFWRYGPPEIESVLTAEHVVVVEIGGAVAGYATTSVHGSSATLGRLAVAAEHRGRGLGLALVAEAAAWALARGALGLAVCTQRSNAPARALYATAGFIEIGEGYALGVSRL